MTEQSRYLHWHLEQHDNGIVWLGIARQDSNANTLGQAVMQELSVIIDELQTTIRPKGVVIYSRKSSGFIAGADIKEFKPLKTAEEATEMIRGGQMIFDRLSQLSCPTVALIKGFCLGGGYELALACQYRVAVIDKKTKIGLPEVMLGIHPGWGGTVRLPQLIGIFAAMLLILSGRMVDAKKAQKLGMVNIAVPEREAEAAVMHYLLSQPEEDKRPFYEPLLQLELVRPFLGKLLTRQVAKKANPEHYPAPFAVIDNWVEHGLKDTAMLAEAQSIGRMALTPTAKNLVRVFFLRERLKGLAKGSDYRPRHVHVIGAGVMGGDIASWCALRGFHVTLQDTQLEPIAKTFARAATLFQRKLKNPYDVQAAKDRLEYDPMGQAIPRADVIIEAVIEDLEVKRQLFQSLEQRAKPDAILATNTSTLPLEDIGTVMQQPGRLVGIHFFNPVAKMPLVEVIRCQNHDPEMFERAICFVNQIDKLPLPVKSAPGFLVNRVLMPYMLEAMTIYQEGISAPLIDKEALKFGMPMGPMELADTVGLDVCVHAATSMGIELPKEVHDMVKQGRLGKKSGQGIYTYKKGKKITPKGDASANAPKDTVDRLMMRMINEAMACLREGIVEDEELLDAGMIFGTGFAPFRGGIMKYIEDQSRDKVKERLEELAKRYGARFDADEGWAV